MYFQGFEYNELETKTFTIEPSFALERQEILNVEREFIHLGKGKYQFNLCQIFQWILFLQEKTNKISKTIFSRCDPQTIMFLSKGKGNVIQEFGNTGVKVLKKICRECDDEVSFLNEYFVGVYGINYLRLLVPTFSFVYTFENKQKKKIIQQELIENAVTLSFFRRNKNCSTEDIISIFFQLIFSIEVAQNTLFFTHYDLHSDNVLICENVLQEDLHFSVFDKTFSFTNPKYVVKIIDYGFATVTLQNDTIFSPCNNELFIKYGYYPFFTPGTDIFRVLMNMFISNFSEHLFYFCMFLFEHFYKINTNVMNDTTFKSFFHSHYYNISFSKIVQKTPLELLHFIMENKKYVTEVLHLDDFPFSISINKNKYVQYSRKEDDIFKHKLHLEKINKTFMDKNPLHHVFFKKTSDHKQKIKDLDFDNIPLLNLESIDELVEYFERTKWFISYFENYCHDKFFSKSVDKFSLKIVSYSKLYKNLKTIQFWIAFYKDNRFMKKKQTIDYVNKYIQSLSHLFHN